MASFSGCLEGMQGYVYMTIQLSGGTWKLWKKKSAFFGVHRRHILHITDTNHLRYCMCHWHVGPTCSGPTCQRHQLHVHYSRGSPLTNGTSLTLLNSRVCVIFMDMRIWFLETVTEIRGLMDGWSGYLCVFWLATFRLLLADDRLEPVPRPHGFNQSEPHRLILVQPPCLDHRKKSLKKQG